MFTNLLVLDANLEVLYSEIYEGRLESGHIVEIQVDGRSLPLRIETVTTPDINGLYPTAVAIMRPTVKENSSPVSH